MKYSIKVLSIMLLCITAITNASEKNAIMLEKINDPLSGLVATMGAENVAKSRSQMGKSGKIIEYKHCIHNISTDKDSFLMMVQEMSEEVEEGGQFNDTKSVTLIETCPLPADASCDHGNRIEYFYSASNELLEEQKEGCEYFKKKWITY